MDERLHYLVFERVKEEMGYAMGWGMVRQTLGSKQCSIAAVVWVFIASSAAAAAQHLNSTENKLFFMTSSVSVLAELGDAAVNQY